MASEIETLLLEQLKSFKAGQDKIERKLEDLATRISKLETAIADAQPHIVAGDGAHPDHRPDPEAILPSEAEDILIRAGVNSVPGRR